MTGYPTFLFISLAAINLVQNFELIDYTREPYVLIPSDPAYLYTDKETLFHIFNVSDLQTKFKNYDTLRYEKSGSEDPKITILVEQCKDYLEQLTIHRQKRSFNFLGKIIKFITGVPDSDDFELITKKLNEVTENNNQLASINEKVRANIEHLSKTGTGEQLETLLNWLIKELTAIIHTINMAKNGILNTAVLNLEEIRKIIKTEHTTDIPLMEILEHATFKIAQVDMIYIILIKYPKINNKCALYNIRPVEKDEGILQLEKNTMYCDARYISVRECKKYISATICRTFHHTCTQDLLNGLKTNCTQIREYMPQIDEVDNGRILIHGTHKVENMSKEGTYLVLFNKTINIDNENYTNDEDVVMNFLRYNRPSQYDILDIIESQNKERQIPELSIIAKLPEEVENHPIRSIILVITSITIIVVIAHYSIKFYKCYELHQDRITNNRTAAYMKALFDKHTGTVTFNEGES